MKQSDSKQTEYHHLTDDYFWFYGQYALARFFFHKYCPADTKLVLDVGCGPADILQGQADVQAIGADASFKACSFAGAKRHSRMVCCDASFLPFKPGVFDAVLAIEMLEHIKDDGIAAKEIGRVIKSGGAAIVSVPAFQFLWGQHDIWNEHFRRYTRQQLSAAFSQTGLQMIYETYYKLLFFFPLFLLHSLQRISGANKGGNDFVQVPPWANEILKRLLILEAVIAQSLPLPFGVSLFAVLRKAQS